MWSSAPLGLLLLLGLGCALHIQQFDRGRMSHSTLYQQAESMANARNESIILISYQSARVGVGFPRCRIASVRQAKAAVARLLEAKSETDYSLRERVETELVPKLTRMQASFCLRTTNETAGRPRFSAVTSNPVESVLTIVLSVAIIALAVLVGGRCLGDLSRNPITGQHSVLQIPRTVWRVMKELKNTPISETMRGRKID